jgi:hypothetical protein
MILYPVDYEKVNPNDTPESPVSFGKFRSQAKISLGCEKLITIFAIAKRIRV